MSSIFTLVVQGTCIWISTSLNPETCRKIYDKNSHYAYYHWNTHKISSLPPYYLLVSLSLHDEVWACSWQWPRAPNVGSVRHTQGHSLTHPDVALTILLAVKDILHVVGFCATLVIRSINLVLFWRLFFPFLWQYILISVK